MDPHGGARSCRYTCYRGAVAFIGGRARYRASRTGRCRVCDTVRGTAVGSKFERVIAAGAIADATIAGMPLAQAALSMNDHVFDALERWVVHSPSMQLVLS